MVGWEGLHASAQAFVAFRGIRQSLIRQSEGDKDVYV